MLCLSFINFVIRKLRQIKTHPGGTINFIESVIWHCPVSCISINNPLQQRLTVIFLWFGCVFPKCTTFLTGWRPKFSPNSRKWAFSQASTTLAIWRNGTPETHKRFQKKKFELYALNILKNNFKKKHSLLLILTLSKVGITLYISYLAPALPARFVLLDFSSTCWGQTKTNFFDSHLVSHDSSFCTVAVFQGFFRTFGYST